MSHGSPLRMKMGRIGCRSGAKSDGYLVPRVRKEFDLSACRHR